MTDAAKNISYFSVADKTPRQFIAERVYFGFWLQSKRSPSWQGGRAARGKHGGERWKLRAHVFKHKREAEREDDRQDSDLSKPHPVDRLPPARPGLFSLPKQCHQLETEQSNV